MCDVFVIILFFIMLVGFMVLINNVIIKLDGFMLVIISFEIFMIW